MGAPLLGCDRNMELQKIWGNAEYKLSQTNIERKKNPYSKSLKRML